MMEGLGKLIGFATSSFALLGYVWVKKNGGSSSSKKLEQLFSGTCPTDWDYIAEGALNLVLRYVGKEQELKGYVLRVRKNNPHASGGKIGGNPWIESLKFVDNLIVPILGRRYVYPSIQVPLTEKFMQELGQHIEPSRPVKRREHPLDVKLEKGLLMLDNTSIPVGNGPSICFELKIKCGFVPKDCPFVTIPVKKTVDRFTMHQRLKNDSGKLDTLSEYSPLDLFSYEKARVVHALDSLVETPQNNFRMFVDGQMVYPDNKGHGSRAKFASVVAKYPSIQGGVDGLINVLSELLITEPLLHRIRTMQQFDDCDIEGVYPVYKEIIDRGEKVPDLAQVEKAFTPRPIPQTLPTKPAEQYECVNRFLLSCTAKDCSTMIVMKPSPEKGSSSSAKISKESPPETGSNISRTIVKGFHGYMYSCAIVDLDPKPIKKMKHYYELDQEIAKHYQSKYAS